MLILSRKSMESIEIGDSVVVTVLEIQGNKVRLGIDAPKGIHILRSELHRLISDLPNGFAAAVVASSEATS